VIDLIESHGIDTFDASLVRPGEIAFPTRRARDLTPETTPSSASRHPGAFEVHLTDIERQPDGSVVVTIGVPTRVRQTPPVPDDTVPTSGIVERVDPVTGGRVMFEFGRSGDASAIEHRDSR